VPVIIGSIEASLRRIAHYDYWSDNVRRSVLPDSKADMLLFGNAERQIIELSHRLAAGESIKDMHDIRGTALMRNAVPNGWSEIDSTDIDTPGALIEHIDPYAMAEPNDGSSCAEKTQAAPQENHETHISIAHLKLNRATTVIRLPSFEAVKADPVLYAHASRLLHLETNPGNARALVQRHGQRDVWLNPPAIPLSTAEMDSCLLYTTDAADERTRLDPGGPPHPKKKTDRPKVNPNEPHLSL